MDVFLQVNLCVSIMHVVKGAWLNVGTQCCEFLFFPLIPLGTGKQIVVQYIPESAYYAKFPGAQAAVTPLK